MGAEMIGRRKYVSYIEKDV